VPILLSSPTLAGDDYPACVVGISNGDPITVLKADKTRVKIRLHGIDATETGAERLMA
jgi:micrococcal nuclease